MNGPFVSSQHSTSSSCCRLCKFHVSHAIGHMSCVWDAADPLYAKESIWLPFMKKDLGCGPDTIIVVSQHKHKQTSGCSCNLGLNVLDVLFADGLTAEEADAFQGVDGGGLHPESFDLFLSAISDKFYDIYSRCVL